ncbi:histidine-specific methyltransferase [Hypoxylon sp. NC1633]|nr:histidine-specific methyltransferase [Hypoxylon sp. NC1633]
MAVDVEAAYPLHEDHVGDNLSTVFPPSPPADELQHQQVDIIDIRVGGQSLDLKASIRSSLREPNIDGFRSLPSLLLWDELGLRYFEHVTYVPEYYLTNTEISLLEEHSLHLAHSIEPGTIILELGSGCLRKTVILLQALETLGMQIDYYALDLDLKELVRTFQELRPRSFKYVGCHGLWGTYDDGKAWLSQEANALRPKCVLSLGSTTGSFTPDEAGSFWGQWARLLGPGSDNRKLQPDSKIIIGLDGCTNQDKAYAAYNDEGGVNRRFILNALDNANSHLGYKAFDQTDWSVRGEWDADRGRHIQYLIPLRDVQFEGLLLYRGERILVVYSHKYCEKDKSQLWERSRLKEVMRYMNDDGSYGLHILSP